MSHYLLADAEILFWKELSWKFRTVSWRNRQCFELLTTAIATAEANAQEKSVSVAEMALKRQRTAAPTSASSHRGAHGGQAGCSGGHHECDVPIQPQYQPLHFIPPTSNICERFFSLAKLVYADLRKAMKCTTLEFLRLNRHLRDMEMVHADGG